MYHKFDYCKTLKQSSAKAQKIVINKKKRHNKKKNVYCRLPNQLDFSI